MAIKYYRATVSYHHKLYQSARARSYEKQLLQKVPSLPYCYFLLVCMLCWRTKYIFIRSEEVRLNFPLQCRSVHRWPGATTGDSQ